MMRLHYVVAYVSFLVLASSPMMAMSQDEIVQELQKLSKKVQYLENENSALKAQVASLENAKPSVSATQSVTSLPPEEEDSLVQKTIEKIKSGKDLVKVGKGSLSIGGLVQTHAKFSDINDDTFILRRSEIKFYGDIYESIKYAIMIDPAKTLSQNQTKILEQGETEATVIDTTVRQGSRILQDANITWTTPVEHWVVDIGQFKMPITEEGYRSSSKLDTAERGNAVRAFGDKRDIGLMARGSYDLVDLYAGVFNGEELNVTDKNDHKDPLVRVVFKPFTLTEWIAKTLEVGGGAYFGETGEENLTKDRYWAEARWEWERISIKGEYIQAQNDEVDLDGWYAQGGFYFIPKKLQAILKYDVIDLNMDKSDDEENDITAGLNYFILDNNVKLQMNYINKSYESSKIEDENQVIGVLQVAF